jgi:hypothetical protein
MLQAVKQTIPAKFFAQVEIDPVKVQALVKHLRSNGEVPPVVVVDYDGEYMPLDGHHRLSAAKVLGIHLEAWVVPGEAFEDLDRDCRDNDNGRAEDHVMCDGVPAMKVAREKTMSPMRLTLTAEPMGKDEFFKAMDTVVVYDEQARILVVVRENREQMLQEIKRRYAEKAEIIETDPTANNFVAGPIVDRLIQRDHIMIFITDHENEIWEISRLSPLLNTFHIMTFEGDL